nr:hypothetical protein [Tanacetum cinerariifolium]
MSCVFSWILRDFIALSRVLVRVVMVVVKREKERWELRWGFELILKRVLKSFVCTEFLEAATDEYIYEFISMDKFPISNWARPSDKVVSFLNRCFEKGNAEALFRHGMREYFVQDESSKQGLELLKSSAALGNWSMQDCRDRTKFILFRIWINHKPPVQKVHTKCPDQDHDDQFRKRPCGFDTNQKISSCDTCMWYRELVFFCRTMTLDVIITK